MFFFEQTSEMVEIDPVSEKSFTSNHQSITFTVHILTSINNIPFFRYYALDGDYTVIEIPTMIMMTTLRWTSKRRCSRTH